MNTNPTTSPMDDLAACPAISLHTVDRGPPTVFQRRHDVFGVYCRTCQCSTEYYPTEAEARAAWNTRSPIAPSREEDAQRVLDAFNGGLVNEPVDESVNKRGYITRYQPLKAMRAALASIPPGSDYRRGFQQRVGEWMQECFGPRISADLLERRDRLVEEALELAQTLPAFSAERAHALVDYVFSRPVGLTEQEVGGVSVTLAALCEAEGISQQHWAEVELARILRPEIVEKIRAKHASKPVGSALPVPAIEGLIGKGER